MVRKALALLVIVAVVGAVLGVVGLLRPNTVDAQAPNAIRSFSGITSVSAGGELNVMITAREYGSPGRVEETLPDGFSYVDGSTVPGPEDIRVSTVVGADGRTTVRFTLDGEEEFTYKVTASSTEEDYSFSGILKDEDRAEYQISGDSMITVGAAGEPDQPMEPDQPTQPDPAPTGANAMRSFSGITSVSVGGELSVMITAREYGSPGRVEETLPDGFSYVEGSTVPGPEDIRVTMVVGDDGRTTVRFTLDGEEEFTYKVTVSSTERDYSFSGILKDEDRAVYQISGDSMITVGAGAPMPGAGPSATRSFSGMTSVPPGGELSVMITAQEYGSPGRVEETLPDGFSYVEGSTVPGSEDIRVTTVVGDDGLTTVRFTLEDDEEFTYKVTASSMNGVYSFSGILKDDDRAAYQISGDVRITVGAVATRSLPTGPVRVGTQMDVMMTARGYGSPGRVEETLPDGFSYVDGSTVPGMEDIRVTAVSGDDGRTTVRFTLDGDEEFTYKVTASGTPGTYTFMGVLKDEDKVENVVAGDSRVMVEAPATIAPTPTRRPSSRGGGGGGGGGYAPLPIATPTPMPTRAPVATIAPTPTPIIVPTVVAPTPEPTAAPKPEPTAVPPTAIPTPRPTAIVMVPTVAPTKPPEPTAMPEPTAVPPTAAPPTAAPPTEVPPTAMVEPTEPPAPTATIAPTVAPVTPDEGGMPTWLIILIIVIIVAVVIAAVGFYMMRMRR